MNLHGFCKGLSKYKTNLFYKRTFWRKVGQWMVQGFFFFLNERERERERGKCGEVEGKIHFDNMSVCEKRSGLLKSYTV